MHRNSMPSRSWVRALSASAAIAISRINHAYLYIKHPVRHHSYPPSPHRGRFLNSMRYPHRALAVYCTRLILIGFWLSSPAQVHGIFCCIHIPFLFYLSPSYFVRSYVCAHTTLYAQPPPLTLLLVLLWTSRVLCTRCLLYHCSSLQVLWSYSFADLGFFCV